MIKLKHWLINLLGGHVKRYPACRWCGRYCEEELVFQKTNKLTGFMRRLSPICNFCFNIRLLDLKTNNIISKLHMTKKDFNFYTNDNLPINIGNKKP